ncbi:MAG TPA: hypothetical protein VGN13_05540 [Solirubrobacteraceae bacterium]
MSRGLGQGELLEVAPARRLIVPAGHSAWWGVDPGVRRVALATIDAEGRRGVSNVPFPTLEGGERLRLIYEESWRLGCEIARLLAPGVIVCEQPSGKQPNPALSYAVGVIMCGVYSGARAATHAGVRLETVASSRWKSVACGDGALWKPKPGSAKPYGVLTWARGVGYAGSSFDDADAMGVAEYARRTFALEQR